MITTTIKAYGRIEELELQELEYTNGRRAIRAICFNKLTGKEPWGMLTINIPKAKLGPNEIIIKNYSENAEWVPQILKQFPEIFKNTGKTIQNEYVTCPIYQFIPK